MAFGNNPKCIKPCFGPTAKAKWYKYAELVQESHGEERERSVLIRFYKRSGNEKVKTKSL